MPPSVAVQPLLPRGGAAGRAVRVVADAACAHIAVFLADGSAEVHALQNPGWVQRLSRDVADGVFLREWFVFRRASEPDQFGFAALSTTPAPPEAPFLLGAHVPTAPLRLLVGCESSLAALNPGTGRVEVWIVFKTSAELRSKSKPARLVDKGAAQSDLVETHALELCHPYLVIGGSREAALSLSVLPAEGALDVASRQDLPDAAPDARIVSIQATSASRFLCLDSTGRVFLLLLKKTPYGPSLSLVRVAVPLDVASLATHLSSCGGEGGSGGGDAGASMVAVAPRGGSNVYLMLLQFGLVVDDVLELEADMSIFLPAPLESLAWIPPSSFVAVSGGALDLYRIDLS